MIRFEVDATKANRRLTVLSGRAEDARPWLKKFRLYIISQTRLMFHKLRKGGQFRGVEWADLKGRPHTRTGRGGHVTREGAFGGYSPGVYSDVASRKTLGGRRNTGYRTLGALRPSGKRVTLESAVMQDTGTLLRRAGQWIKKLNHNEITFGVGNLIYAARQNKMRLFMFFELPRDLNEGRRLCKEHFEGR